MPRNALPVTEDQIDIARLTRASLHLVSGCLSWALFIFCVYKTAKKRRCDRSRRRKVSCFQTFSVTDLLVMFMSLYDALNSMFYFVLYDRKRILGKFLVSGTIMDTYDYIWASAQILFEIGGVVAYTLLSIYSVAVIEYMIRQTNSIIAIKINGNKTASNKVYVNALVKNERTTKIAFITICIALPLILMIIPHFLTDGYVYSNLALWPFLNSEKYYSIYFYYVFIIIACIASIAQLIATFCSLKTIRRMNQISYEERMNSLQLSSSYEESDNIVFADADFHAKDNETPSKGAGSTTNTAYRMTKEERRVFIAALVKNLLLTIGFAIQWWPAAVLRIYTSGTNNEFSYTNMLLFSIFGPCLSGFTTVMYFTRVGANIKKMKHSSKKKPNNNNGMKYKTTIATAKTNLSI